MHGPFIARPTNKPHYVNWFETVQDIQEYMKYGNENASWVILERLHITTEGQELWRQVEMSQVLADTGR